MIKRGGAGFRATGRKRKDMRKWKVVKNICLMLIKHDENDA
jgi:hypothetical protein